MTKLKKWVTLGSIVLALGITSTTAYATSEFKTPAEAVASLTNRTVESVTAEKAETGKTYGTIAKDAGKLEEFKKETLEIKKDILAQKVKDGKMTQAQADDIIKKIEDNQAKCDGTGSAKIGKGMGAGFGQGQGKGQGRGQGGGRGQGQKGLGNGSCVTQ